MRGMKNKKCLKVPPKLGRYLVKSCCATYLDQILTQLWGQFKTNIWHCFAKSHFPCRTTKFSKQKNGPATDSTAYTYYMIATLTVSFWPKLTVRLWPKMILASFSICFRRLYLCISWCIVCVFWAHCFQPKLPKLPF